jgi:hypothetical protein
MANNINRIAKRLGAKVVATVPETGGGAFGAARLGLIVQALHARVKPGQGLRAGRPSDPSWVRHPKVPISDITDRTLVQLADEVSNRDQS